MTNELLAFLLDNVSCTHDNCIIWPWSCDQWGYGQLKKGRYSYKASTEMCSHAHGPKPFPGAMALHSCHNPSCVNPNHLRWGTAKENANERNNNVLFTIDGETKTAAQWCNIFGTYNTLVRRRLLAGWSVKDAFTKENKGPVNGTKSNQKF